MRVLRIASRWSLPLCVLVLLVAGLTLSRSTAADDRGAPGARRFFGVVRAVVVDVQDPDAAGRIKVKFPSLPNAFESWAAVSLPLGGNQSGLWALPEIGDEVVVAFEQGNPSNPVVLGSLWNGKRPPTSSSSK
jgi:uncharacterized protein involved in type VI secretion and phage assembly